MAVERGQKLSHYRLIEKIGEGGMGVVWKAEDTVLGRTVAIKVLPVETARDEKRRKMFFDEARLASSLSEAHIVQVHEFGREGDLDFLVMEYVEGKPLKRILQGKPLPSETVVQIGLQVARALAKAHRQGLLHRDLKPANVLVGPDDEVKIVDFGLATLFTPERTTVDPDAATHSGTIPPPARPESPKGRPAAGTIPYMSPEQVRGEDLDARSDIFSLGVILYEMTTGQRPFGGATNAETAGEILKGRPRPVHELVHKVPLELDRIALKTLAPRPGDRYQSMEDLAVDLKRLGRDLESGSSPSFDELGKAGRRGRLRGLGWTAAAAGVVLAASVVGYLRFSPDGSAPTRQMIVVLPFQNLGQDEDEYFASGITEDITRRLAAARNLAVISRHSAAQYRGTDKTVRQIGRELRVDYILEGTIRWERNPKGGNRVQVVPELIRVSDDTHLWSDRYERDMEDIFEVQSEIAKQVVKQLDITLLEREAESLDARPTQNLDAYHAFLRGNATAREEATEWRNVLRAIRNFEGAVELDPKFTLAWAALSKTNSELFHRRGDGPEEPLVQARNAADQALTLDPGSPEGHEALGYYYYWGLRDLPRAMEELALAAEQQGDDSDTLLTLAIIRRRRGRFGDALKNLDEAYRLNPRDPALIQELAITYGHLRRYADANRFFDLYLSLVPGDEWGHVRKAFNWLGWRGEVAGMRGILERMPRTDDPAMGFVWTYEYMLEGFHRKALDRLAEIPLDTLDAQGFYVPKKLLEGRLQHLLGDARAAESSYASARTILEAAVKRNPEDPRIHASLAVAYALVGRKNDALREARIAVDLYPISHDAVEGPTFESNLALVYTLVGDTDAALDRIEFLLSIPAGITIGYLKTEPMWQPLRTNPRFQEIVKKHS